ncbi:MAG: hypothetical protein OEU86_07275 [Gammaproteobacteria bacterium]|nr:hypothetical protein [Gammaproteobacteria bacterium]
MSAADEAPELTSELTSGQPSSDTSADTGLEPEAMDLCKTATGAYLNVSLYGAIATQLDWNEQVMDCDGMTRPNENGIRLVFSGPWQQERLLIVIGIDGDFEQLMEGERKANITIIAEDAGRFYSTGNQDRCWTTIDQITEVSDETDSAYKVSGEAYCAGSLPSLSDNASITIRNLRYSGRLSLSESDDE